MDLADVKISQPLELVLTTFTGEFVFSTPVML